MLQSLSGGGPIVRVGLNHPEHQVLAVLRVPDYELLDCVSLALNVPSQEFRQVLTAEEVTTRDQVEENCPKAENVHFVGVTLVFEDFGRNIAG